FLRQNEEKELLRLSTAGSVDDGKSTLIGRLLYDSKGVYEDQIASVRKASVNQSAGPLDFALLTDGLRAEREQGITIDVAYRYFIPIGALRGDNVVERSARMPWFEGPSLLHYLETVHIGNDQNLTDMRFAVQYVIRPTLDFRGYAGQVTSGVIRKGDPVMTL